MTEDGRQIGVGLLGYEFMGRAHVNAYRTLPYILSPPPLTPRLVAVAGRTEPAVQEAAARFGFEGSTTAWQDLVADPRVELFDHCGPNGLHAEATIAAARAGKHVLCEKPLGRTAAEAHAMWRAAAESGVQHMCAFNYRFVPAVRLARELLEAGELGEIRHFRAHYLQEWVADPAAPMTWRLDRAQAGSGALGDLGSHLVDLARYLVGEPEAVTGVVKTFVTDRTGGVVNVDDAFAATVELAGGVVGTLEASRFASGRKNGLWFEINGSRGSLVFDLERLNELQVHMAGSKPAWVQGLSTVLVTEPGHPFMEHWWPAGHIIGWEHTFVHEVRHLLAAIAGEGEVAPHGATFADGYRAAEVCDAILRAASTGERQEIRFRSLTDGPEGAVQSRHAQQGTATPLGDGPGPVSR
jgi:predicted dehydrogenase